MTFPDQRFITFQCPFHKLYRAVKRPSIPCWFCETMYQWTEALKTRGQAPRTITGKYPSRRRDGRYEYEISPGRWVSRQRVYQMRRRNDGAYGTN